MFQSERRRQALAERFHGQNDTKPQFRLCHSCPWCTVPYFCSSFVINNRGRSFSFPTGVNNYGICVYLHQHSVQIACRFWLRSCRRSSDLPAGRLAPVRRGAMVLMTNDGGGRQRKERGTKRSACLRYLKKSEQPRRHAAEEIIHQMNN